MLEVETRNVAGGTTSIGSAGPYTLMIDRAADAGGGGLGFNGGQLLHLAIAGCVANDVYREAGALGVEVTNVRVACEGEWSGDPLVANDISYRVVVDGPSSEEDLDRLIRHVDAIAEVPETLRRGTKVTLAGSSARSTS